MNIDFDKIAETAFLDELQKIALMSPGKAVGALSQFSSGTIRNALKHSAATHPTNPIARRRLSHSLLGVPQASQQTGIINPVKNRIQGFLGKAKSTLAGSFQRPQSALQPQFQPA